MTGDPGYPDYPIPIPPNETSSEMSSSNGMTSFDLEIESELPADGSFGGIPIRPIPLKSLVRLYDLESDPTEQNDISNSNLEVRV